MCKAPWMCVPCPSGCGVPVGSSGSALPFFCSTRLWGWDTAPLCAVGAHTGPATRSPFLQHGVGGGEQLWQPKDHPPSGPPLPPASGPLCSASSCCQEAAGCFLQHPLCSACGGLTAVSPPVQQVPLLLVMMLEAGAICSKDGTGSEGERHVHGNIGAPAARSWGGTGQTGAGPGSACGC